MNYGYLVTPFIAWLCAGMLKFLVNSISVRRLAFKQIGYGGFPSNHSAIVSSTAAIVAINEGVQHPSFGIAITLAFIVILDASSLRRQVGRHALAINNIVDSVGMSARIPGLRTRMGHSPIEIAGGVIVGLGAGWLVAHNFH